MNLNKVFIAGNITKDPDKRSLPSGQPVASFGVATNRFYTDQTGQKQQDVEFHNVVAFGKLAEIITQYLGKGSLILVEGRLKTRNWQDQAGVKHFRTDIIAESIQMGPKGAGLSGGGERTAYQPSTGFSAGPAINQAPKIQNVVNKADIPTIEDNQPQRPATPSTEADGSIFEEEPSEIDVKDIPF